MDQSEVVKSRKGSKKKYKLVIFMKVSKRGERFQANWGVNPTRQSYNHLLVNNLHLMEV